MLSTNWSINIDKLVSFIKAIDKKSNKKIRFTIQLSIDGPEGEYTEQGHNVKWEIYKKNNKLFGELTNSYKFKNIFINFIMNSTVNHDLFFKNFSNYEGIAYYVRNMRDFSEDLENNILNRATSIDAKVSFPGLNLPAAETVEEGLEIAKIIRLWEYIRNNEFNDLQNFHPFYKNFYYGLHAFNVTHSLYNANAECSQLKTTLTFLPDGRIVECSSSYMEVNKEFQKELLEAGENKKYQASLIHEANSINPLTATPEELKKYKWSVTNGLKNTSSTYMYFSAGLAKELALSGQIPHYYYDDKEKLSKHLIHLCGLRTCTRENIDNTMNGFLNTPSTIRRFLNGAAEYIHEDIEQGLKKELFNGNL